MAAKVKLCDSEFGELISTLKTIYTDYITKTYTLCEYEKSYKELLLENKKLKKENDYLSEIVNNYQAIEDERQDNLDAFNSTYGPNH